MSAVEAHFVQSITHQCLLRVKDVLHSRGIFADLCEDAITVPRQLMEALLVSDHVAEEGCD